jgi:deferrochelatase/peroxidase EfeB
MPPPRSRPAGVPIAERGPGWSYRPDESAPSLHARRQPGIATPRLDHVQLAAFALPGGAEEVLRALTAAAGELLGPELTVTVGLGPGVFTARTRPVALRELPAFPGDALDPAWSGGDLALQVCATRAEDAAAAMDRLASLVAEPRWRQAGALRREPGDDPAGTPRDPFGFRDGTHNLKRGRDLDRHVWVDRGDRTGMVDGTYLVVRRIELDVAGFAGRPLEEQELLVGRHRGTGAPLGGRREFDPARPDSFPPGSHVRLAAASTNASPPMLRRSYSFDGGLLFLAFMRDPHRQFVPVQRRLAEQDRLSAYARHTGSAVFAVPPGARRGCYVGDRLLEP